MPPEIQKAAFRLKITYEVNVTARTGVMAYHWAKDPHIIRSPPGSDPEDLLSRFLKLFQFHKDIDIVPHSACVKALALAWALLHQLGWGPGRGRFARADSIGHPNFGFGISDFEIVFFQIRIPQSAIRISDRPASSTEKSAP